MPAPIWTPLFAKIDEMISAINALCDCFSGGEPQVFPDRAELDWRNIVVTGDTMEIVTDGDQHEGYYVKTTADGAEMVSSVLLAGASDGFHYELTLIGQYSLAGGNAAIFIDDIEGSGLSYYGDPEQKNFYLFINTGLGNLSTAGLHKISIKVDGADPLSTGFETYTTKLLIQLVAD